MRINGILLLFVCIMALSSCGNDGPEDKSLSQEEYLNLGIPDPYKIWRSNDFALAHAVLENIKSTKPYNLPLKGSRKSGVVFDRMVSLENMDFLQDKSLHLVDKLRLSERFLRN